MVNYANLVELGKLIGHLEQGITQASLNILAYEHREEIARNLITGLLGQADKHAMKIETSSGEYTNEIAVLQVGKNKYRLEKDHQDVFISKINHYNCRIVPGTHGILVYHIDYPGVIRDVSRILATHHINISSMNVSREQKGKNALLVSLTDENIDAEVMDTIMRLPQITNVVALPPLERDDDSA